jgi:hypothetical protein
MKRKIYYIAAATLFSMGLSSCNNLDTIPEDSYVTADQKEESVEMNPELASAGVVGISAVYPRVMSVYAEAHFDFGWPSLGLMLDSGTADLVSSNIGYNWYSTDVSDYSWGTNTAYVGSMSWYLGYKVIKAANDVIASIGAEPESAQLQLFAAQGYANRAYIYFTLAQLYQYTYVGHESLPCVPLITDLNSDEAALNGAPRATVQEVYDQILSDLNTAIDLLTKSGLPVTEIASTGSKRFVSLGTAYGLRARVNLVMNNWQAAADDAAKAIQTSGCTPLSIEEASRPGFWDSNDHECMWAIYIQETDRAVTSGIVNFPSMMGSFNSNGYWTVGATRRINKALYAAIGTNDARKGWWLSSSGSSNNLTSAEAKFLAKFSPEGYTQVKFGAYQNEIGTVTNANDYFLMRVEEMYLIQAEATAMAGNPSAGATMLENFIKTYRNPSYTVTASSKEEVQEECWLQRRIELWGEGLAYFDLLRLNKGLDRRGGGWESVWVYNVPAPLKPILIPNGEMQANKAIGDNNEAWAKPSPVDDI